MRSIFWVQVEAIPGFVDVPSLRGIEKFEVLVCGYVRVLGVPSRIGLIFFGGIG